MTPRAKAMLEALDDLFSDPDDAAIEAATEVWDVITALRGPDAFEKAPSTVLKNYITVPIRRAALPKTTAAASGAWARARQSYDRPMRGNAFFSVWDLPEGVAPLHAETIGARLNEWVLRKDYWSLRDAHFMGHARRAARVLGIE